MRSLLFILFAVPAFAQERTHDVTPADYFTLARILEVAVSPDGKQVAYSEARWSTDDDLFKADLWVIATDGKTKPVRLTFDRANDRNLKWSADAKTIYFLGNRKSHGGKTNVYSILAAGGDPRPITKEGVDHYDLSPKANCLFYSTEITHHDDDAFAKLRNQYKLDYGHGVRKVSRIHKLDLDSWRTEQVYDGKRYVREFATTQDGKKLAMVTAFDDTVVKSEGESRVDILEDGKIVTPPTDVYRKNAASPNAWIENLSWSNDGDQVVFNAVFDGYPASLIVVSNTESKWHCRRMPFEVENQINGYARSSGKMNQWIENKVIFYVSEKDGNSSIGLCLPDYPGREKQIDGNGNLYGYSLGHSSGSIDADREQKTTFTEMALIVATNDRLAHLRFGQFKEYDPNPHTDTWKLPTVKHITWKAPDGTTVGGVLELPPGYDGKKPLPLVVAIHGGPTTSAKAALEFDPHNGRMYFSCAGYAVLCPNYRGSTGYGDKFVTDLIGRENDIEVKDIIAGVEHLVKKGIADKERVGVMGWSNGGYLTNCLITKKDLPFKIKAASSGAGIVDTVAEWGFNDEPAYPKVFKKGHPWEQPELYKKTSPTYDLMNIKTPTIIHVGGNDVRCPPGHSRMLYRAMKEYLNVPCELCEYPGEPHGLSKMQHRKAKMEWDLAWFDKYLK